jgi:ribA/ribD-fused uncharacterized protein
MHYTLAALTEQYDRDQPLKFIYFWGHTSRPGEPIGKFCLSQWYECPFVVGGFTYNTSEHFMMAQKARLFKDEATFQKIIQSRTPGEAKDLGRLVADFDEQTWLEHRFDIVKTANRHKFGQNPELGEYLRKTGERVLVEASPIDRIWGIGMAEDDKDIANIHAWRGLNLLGFALMEVRDELKS